MELTNTTVAWKPQPGPQTLGVQCPATELMLGGAVGGGKSDFLLGDFARDIGLGSAWQGVYFRKYFPDMDRIIQRAQEIFTPIYGAKCWSASKYQFNFPTGACLRFRALEKDNDVLKFQGQDYCLSKNDLICMADGTKKKICDVKVGDKVMTLEGPQAVLETHGPFVKECVEAVVKDKDGNVVFTQKHPLDHPILTSSGVWSSYQDLCSKMEFQASGRPSTLDLSDQKETEGAGTCSSVPTESNQESSQPGSLSVPVMLHEQRDQSDETECGTGSPNQCHERDTSSAQCPSQSKESPSTPEGQQQPCAPSERPQGPYTASQAHGGQGDSLDSGTKEDSQCDCSSCHRQNDEQPRRQSDSGQCDLPSQDDAGERSQKNSQMDGLGKTQSHSRSACLYEHPYNGGIREATEKVTSGSCEMTPCGECEVFDLTVENVAHYLSGVKQSKLALPNRNSWIGFDELTQWASPYAYTYLFSTRLRSAKGVKVRMRCATNPGGPGHAWVRARFVDPMPPGTGLHVKTGKTSYWRVFIPSKLEDNQILMKSDPSYGDRIYEGSDQALAKALREGRWDIVAGAAFTEFDPNVHVVDPAPIPTDKPAWRSMDWGFKTPYCNLHIFTDNDGDIVVGNEIYGWSGTPNVGTEEYPSEVHEKIDRYERAHDLYVPKGYLDNQCWEEKGQAGTIYRELCGPNNDMRWKPWKKGPNSRILQKQGLHDLMKVVNGRSRLKIMRNCVHLIRTLPMIPTSKNNMEDVDTDSEDHGYDALRGGVNHRMPTRAQIREKARMRHIRNMEYISPGELQYGGF